MQNQKTEHFPQQEKWSKSKKIKPQNPWKGLFPRISAVFHCINFVVAMFACICGYFPDLALFQLGTKQKYLIFILSLSKYTKFHIKKLPGALFHTLEVLLHIILFHSFIHNKTLYFLPLPALIIIQLKFFLRNILLVDKNLIQYNGTFQYYEGLRQNGTKSSKKQAIVFN